MTRRDRIVTSLLVLALLVFGMASLAESPSVETATGAATPPPAGSGEPSLPIATTTPVVAYREGVLGHPSSITPLTARTQADRDLVALVFRGLVRLGPDGTLLPDVAAGWTMDAARRQYTFTIRPDATWQDGEPVTATDVAFTVGLLNDPAYGGALAGSWSEVKATVVDARTVRLDLATPLGGFLQAATLPLLPEHLLGRLPVTRLADSSFARLPVGNGPYRLVSLDASRAVLEAVPAVLSGSFRPAPSAAPSPSPSADSSPSAAPTGSPVASASVAPPSASATPAASPSLLPLPTPAAGSPPQRIELDFFDDASSLIAALEGRRVDAAGGLSPADATPLATAAGLRLVRYPRATLTAVLLNLRPARRELLPTNVRVALLAAIDRDRLVRQVLLGTGTVADTPIPPASWAFDAKAAKRVPHDTKNAATLLKKQGWTRKSSGWYAPNAKKPFTIEIVTPDGSSNPIAWAAAESVAADWRSFGLFVSVVPLPPATLVDDRLTKASFAAAVVDVNVGLDPDLYPLLASTQAVSGGSNVGGVQIPELDKMLVAARSAGADSKRTAAYSALQAYLARAEIVLPLFFRDYLFVASDTLRGVEVRQLGDPSDRFWDVLDWRLAGAG